MILHLTTSIRAGTIVAATLVAVAALGPTAPATAAPAAGAEDDAAHHSDGTSSARMTVRRRAA